MIITPKTLLKIKHRYPGLTGKYRRIADYILAAPDRIVRHKAREIARDCGCDDSLIIRFCQKIGFAGFSELKAALASEFMPVSVALAESSSPPDSFARVRRDFLEHNSRVMHDTLSLLDESNINQAVRLLTRARRIFLLGAGASGMVAMDIHAKLLRLGYNAIYHPDADFARIFCGLIEPRDAVLAVSFSGESRMVCDLAALARAKKTPVISVTNFPHARLGQMSDVCLLTASDEKIFRLGAMTSRIAQLLILDFLIVCMTMRAMDRAGEKILRTHAMLGKTMARNPALQEK